MNNKIEIKNYKNNIRDGIIILSVGAVLIIIFVYLLITKANEKTISDIMISGLIGQLLFFVGLFKTVINNNKIKKLKEE